MYRWRLGNTVWYSMHADHSDAELIEESLILDTITADMANLRLINMSGDAWNYREFLQEEDAKITRAFELEEHWQRRII